MAEPWKNGGGTTCEIAGARGADGIDWRISIAEVARAGPFSSFVGVERTLVVIAGTLDLRIGPCMTVTRLDEHAPPLVFPGDMAVVASPIEGPASVLNLMVRPAKVRGRIDWLAARCALRPASRTVTMLVAPIAGDIAVGRRSHSLVRHDAILVDGYFADDEILSAGVGLWRIEVCPA